MHQGQHYPVLENRSGEPYAIHGDGWLQKWRLTGHTADTLELTLKSDRFDAFHMSGKPGLAVLSRGQSLSLKTRFRVSRV